MQQIPRSLLPHVALVRVPDTSSDYGGKFKDAVQVQHVRYERVLSMRATDYSLQDGTGGLLFVDSVNSTGAFEIPEGSKISIDGGDTWSIVLKVHPYEQFGGRVPSLGVGAAMSINVRVNLSGLESMFSEAEHKKRQEEVAMRAAHMMRKYVPVEESTLRDSEKENSDYEHGRLIWNTEYAQKHYYVPMNHTVAGTTDHWDIEMMNRERKDLIEYVKAMYGGNA